MLLDSLEIILLVSALDAGQSLRDYNMALTSKKRPESVGWVNLCVRLSRQTLCSMRVGALSLVLLFARHPASRQPPNRGLVNIIENE